MSSATGMTPQRQLRGRGISRSSLIPSWQASRIPIAMRLTCTGRSVACFKTSDFCCSTRRPWVQAHGLTSSAARSGMEIKTGGGAYDVDTMKQLGRYDKSGQVKAILVIAVGRDHLRRERDDVFRVPVAVIHVAARRDVSFEAQYRTFP
jgi:hypothetical protein